MGKRIRGTYVHDAAQDVLPEWSNSDIDRRDDSRTQFNRLDLNMQPLDYQVQLRQIKRVVERDGADGPLHKQYREVLKQAAMKGTTIPLEALRAWHKQLKEAGTYPAYEGVQYAQYADKKQATYHLKRTIEAHMRQYDGMGPNAVFRLDRVALLLEMLDLHENARPYHERVELTNEDENCEMRKRWNGKWEQKKGDSK